MDNIVEVDAKESACLQRGRLAARPRLGRYGEGERSATDQFTQVA
jgi:hypothetical protein